MMSSAQVKAMVNSKGTMYEACVRNGKLMPSAKSSFCGMDFLNGVRTGENWLPLAKDCRMYTCFSPPGLEELCQAAAEAVM